MKRNLRLGACLAQKNRTFRAPKPRYSGLLAVLLSMCLYAHAQSPEMPGAVPLGSLPDTVTPLQIGDTIPEYLWHLPLQVVNHPEGRDTITLQEYRNKKLIILEFWGSMCPPCIEAVDKLNALKTDFDGDLGVLPFLTLSKIGESTVPFMEKRGWTLPSVVNDTVFSTEVFSNYLSDWGDVWIYEGRLLAVPKHGFLSHSAIKDIIDGRAVAFVNKRNVPEIDPYRPMFSGNNGPGEILFSCSGKIARYDPAYGHWSLQYLTTGNGGTIIHACLPLKRLIYEAFRLEIQPNLRESQAVVWQIDDTLKNLLKTPPRKNETPRQLVEAEERRKANSFCYYLHIPASVDTAQALRMMQSDLKEFVKQHFNMDIRVEHAARHRYAVLRPITTPENALRLSAVSNGPIAAGRHATGGNAQIGLLILRLNRALAKVSGLGMTVNRLVDSSGLSPAHDYNFVLSRQALQSGSLADIQNELRRYGLRVNVVENDVPVVVVRQPRHGKPNHAYLTSF